MAHDIFVETRNVLQCFLGVASQTSHCCNVHTKGQYEQWQYDHQKKFVRVAGKQTQDKNDDSTAPVKGLWVHGTSVAQNMDDDANNPQNKFAYGLFVGQCVVVGMFDEARQRHAGDGDGGDDLGGRSQRHELYQCPKGDTGEMYVGVPGFAVVYNDVTGAGADDENHQGHDNPRHAKHDKQIGPFETIDDKQEPNEHVQTRPQNGRPFFIVGQTFTRKHGL